MSRGKSNSGVTENAERQQSAVDTIVAEATPQGRAGVSIVRVSGPNARSIAEALSGKVGEPRVARVRPLVDSENALIDEALVLFFKAPQSFTGDDIVEFQTHGGPIVVKRTIAACRALGARMARPGEFSERAFLNGKMDLVQLEAVADLISSESEQAAKNALQSLKGVFSELVHSLTEETTALRVFIEAAIDFSDEEGVDFLEEGEVLSRVRTLSASLSKLLNEAKAGAKLRGGLKLTLVGEPNVGKSSLMNALARQDAAIVTDIAGTTRDVIREEVFVDGWMFQLSDTAGIRETNDPVEVEGVQRSHRAMSESDVALYLIDAETLVSLQTQRTAGPSTKQSGIDDWALEVALPTELLGTKRPGDLFVINKIDRLAVSEQTTMREGLKGRTDVAMTSLTEGSGLEVLEALIADRAETLTKSESTFSARERHVEALQVAQAALADAQQGLEEDQPGELVAEDLRRVQDALGEITGRITSDALLGRIFSSFCIGK